MPIQLLLAVPSERPRGVALVNLSILAQQAIDLGPGAVIAVTLFSSLLPGAQTDSSRVGAAEKAGRAWAYPEPAQRGATGYSPDYSKFTKPSERWDIYFNILWRRSVTSNRSDIEYYNDQLSDLMDTMPASARKSTSALPIVIKQIRDGQLRLPYRDATTGCLLFMVKHDKRMDLAADDCSSAN